MLKLKKIIFIISILIIIAGIIVILTKGFNMGIDYSQSKNVKIYFTEAYDNENVNQMLNDVFGNSLILVYHGQRCASGYITTLPFLE